MEIVRNFVDLFVKPFENPEMIWMLIPLVATVVLMEYYFFKHKKEKIGWNTATANSLVLIFVSMDLLRYLVRENLLFRGLEETLLVLFVLAEGIFLFIFNFHHKWPGFLAFTLSSHFTINLIAYVTVVIVYSSMEFSLGLFFAVMIFLIILNILLYAIRQIFGSNEDDYQIS